MDLEHRFPCCWNKRWAEQSSEGVELSLTEHVPTRDSALDIHGDHRAPRSPAQPLPQGPSSPGCSGSSGQLPPAVSRAGSSVLGSSEGVSPATRIAAPWVLSLGAMVIATVPSLCTEHKS